MATPDVRAELRAHTMALDALRETQLGQRLRKGFATIHLGLAQIVAQLRTIEGS